MTRRIYTLLGTLAVALVMAVGLAPAAHATSTHCATYGATIKWNVRNGSFCSTVNGDGTAINHIGGTFGTTIFNLNAVCNPSIKVDIYDRWGNWLTWRQGPQQSGCKPWAVNYVSPIGVYANFPNAAGGYAKVTLQSYGAPVASNNHRLG